MVFVLVALGVVKDGADALEKSASEMHKLAKDNRERLEKKIAEQTKDRIIQHPENYKNNNE